MRNKIRPTVDCVFKAIFGKKENRNLLINFLNAVLGLEKGKRVSEVTVLNPYNEKEFESGKLSIVDVKARDESGRTFQVEVQISIYSWLANRMLHNWAGIYHPQLTEGEDYDILNPVTSIWILEGALFRPDKPADGKDYLHLTFEARERSLGFPMNDHFGIHVLQLPYWPPEGRAGDDRERWIHFFREGENMDVNNLPAEMDTEEMRQAFGVLDRFAKNKDEYLLYLSRLDAVRHERTWENTVRREKERREQAEGKALREKEQREKAEEKALKAEEKALKAEEKALKAEEKALGEKEQKEQLQKEKEELIKLLKQAGIEDIR